MPFRWPFQLGASQASRRIGLFWGVGLAALLCGVASLPAVTVAADGERCDASCVEARRALVVGDWYVLIHFEDPEAEDGPGPQWDDQIWRIEASGENLRWTIFPHVELKNAQGRYMETSDGLVARSSGTWSPDPKQWKEIRTGLKADPYATRSKTLRTSSSGEWRSSGRLRSGSASMVGYHELWQIAFKQGEPVFSRVDSMGSGRTDVLAGQTRFTTESRDPAKGEMAGRYKRGEQVEGRFRMVRMGDRDSGSDS